MKLLLGLAFLILAAVGYSQTTKKVLFIGNSYTSANNLPGLIASLATADGNTLTFDAHVPGGSQFNQHAVNATVLNKIAADDWDFVVLQEQSQKPSFPYAQVQSDVYPFAETLVDSIYSNNECSVPLFYSTWGRENGDAQWDSINTFEKMNARLFNAYGYMADQAEGMMSPVGIGFSHVKQDGPAVVGFTDLYVNDGSHPSIKGSYLAACIFNNIVFSQTSTGNTFLPAGVTANEVAYLQSVADHVVYDVDSVQIDFRPSLSINTFNFTVNGADVSFTSEIQEGNFENWDFGDGQTSTQQNTVHSYANTGAYEVTLFSSDNCYSDSIKKQVVISSLDLKTEQFITFNVYPNPSSDGIIHIELTENQDYSMYTLLGEEIYTGQVKELLLTKGIYILKIKNQSRKIIVL
jgi:hypothetical protein